MGGMLIDGIRCMRKRILKITQAIRKIYCVHQPHFTSSASTCFQQQLPSQTTHQIISSVIQLVWDYVLTSTFLLRQLVHVQDSYYLHESYAKGLPTGNSAGLVEVLSSFSVPADAHEQPLAPQLPLSVLPHHFYVQTQHSAIPKQSLYWL